MKKRRKIDRLIDQIVFGRTVVEHGGHECVKTEHDGLLPATVYHKHISAAWGVLEHVVGLVGSDLDDVHGANVVNRFMYAMLANVTDGFPYVRQDAAADMICRAALYGYGYGRQVGSFRETKNRKGEKLDGKRYEGIMHMP